MIALTILIMGIAFSSAIIGSSIRNVNLSKNRIIAVNIAREGIEAVRNIRDTNWLKSPNKMRECWNHMPYKTDDQENCTNTEIKLNSEQNDLKNKIANEENGYKDLEFKSFIVYKDIYHSWRIMPAMIDENTEGVKDFSPLYLVDIQPTIDSDGDYGLENDTDIYNHDLNGYPQINYPINSYDTPSALGQEYVKETPFKRWIEIEYVKDDGTKGDASNNRMIVTSIVEWWGGTRNYRTSLKALLADYMDRENFLN